MFTTVPISIRKPSSDGMEIVASTIHSRKKEPISANGRVVMTMNEKRIDSNCAAMTTQIRKIAMTIAMPSELNSSIIIFVLELSA